MADNFVPGSVSNDTGGRRINEAVCIDTSRVYDSCADKDCLSDLRVYFTENAQSVVDSAVSVRCRGCDVLDVVTEVERVPFNKGYYSVDLTFFFLVSLDCLLCPNAPAETINGLCVFSKKCILYGSEGSVKIFSSEFRENANDCILPPTQTSPRAKVQVAEPICLDARICRPCDCCNNIGDLNGIPGNIRRYFPGQFASPGQNRAIRVTIGLFSIIRLERDVQMLIPAYSFCVPDKECSCNTENPCDSFKKIRFPVSEFFPPDESDAQTEEDAYPPGCGCGCGRS